MMGMASRMGGQAGQPGAAGMQMCPCPMCGGTGMAPEGVSPEQERQGFERYRDELRKELAAIDERLARLEQGGQKKRA